MSVQAVRTDTPEHAVASLVELVRARAAADRHDLVHATMGSGESRAALVSVLAELRPRADELTAWAGGIDVVGSAYELLLTGAERRQAGQFQTPFWAADLMAAWLLSEPTRLLVDPGVGAGRLLFRAGIREDAPERMLGLDVDPVSCAMARMNLTLRGLEDRAELRQADFLLDELAEAPDAVSCNPPYSRHHSIAAEAKAAIHEGFQRRLGVRFSRLAALHALFLVRAVEVAAPGARIAFITPGDWLDTNYGRAIKQWVLTQADVEALVLFREDALPFGGSVMSSAAITLLRKHDAEAAQPAAHKTRVVRLPHEPPPVADALAAVTGAPASTLAVEEIELAAASKWSRPAGSKRIGTPLAELARVRRGIATGNNDFFILSEAHRHEWGLPLEELRPCLTTPRLVGGLEVTDLAELGEDVPRWVLACWRPEAEQEGSPLGAYLRHGRELGVPDSYLASRRQPWHGLDRREPPAILWPYFNRTRVRFIRNRAEALPTNNWLGVEPHEDVDADRLWELLNQPSTLKAFLAARRSYAGMTKLEPGELGAVRIRWQTPQMRLAI